MTALVVFLALFGACTDGSVVPPDEIAALHTWPASAEVDPGQALAFAAWFIRTTGDSVPAGVTWSATGGTIDAGGRFTAPATPGSVWVVARDAAGSGAADSSHVAVRAPDPTIPASIQVTPRSVSLHVGATAALSARVANAVGGLLDGADVIWSSTAPAVAAVSGSGGVAGVDEGAARVVARVAGTALADSVDVTVTRAPVAAVSVLPGAITAQVGTSAGFTAAVFGPAGEPLTGRAVAWTSSDEAVATVDAAGRAAALTPGTSVITASAEGVEGTAVLTVTLAPPPPPAAVASVDVTPAVTSVPMGAARAFTATPRAADGSALAGRPVTWSVDQAGVASMAANGTAAGLAPGTTLVRATVEGVTGTATLTVTDTATVVGSVTVSPATAAVETGGTVALTATVRDAGGVILGGAAVAWSSDAPAVATVDAAGTVTAVAAGTAVIRAGSGGVEGVATVTVSDVPPPPPPAVASVEVNPAAASVDMGATAAFGATPRAADGSALTGRTVTWTVDHGAVASVAADGTVTGLTPGSTTVRATSEGVVGTAALTVVDTATVVGSVTVSPGAPALETGATTALTATVHDTAGAVVVGAPVAWSSDPPGVATVDAAGVVTAVSPGTAVVTANSGGVEGAATVTVTDPPPPAVATVDVSPSSTSLTVGATAALTATPRAADGSALTGRPVAWSTAQGGVASVNGSGTVTGVGAGTTTITATVEGVAGTASVTVTVPGGSGLADECQSPGPGWIWCDDFDQNRLSSYFEFDDGGGSFQRTAGAGADGSTGLRAQFSPGQVGAGSLHLAVGRTPQSYMAPADAGTADYRELYWRVYVKNDAGWTGGGGEKLSRAFIFASPSTWAQAMIAHVWSGGPGENHLFLDPVRGTDAAGTLVTTQYNDFANMTWLGGDTSDTPLFDAAHVGVWYCVEARVRLNTAGQSDGVFQLWIDDALEAERTGLNWLGAFSAYGLNAVYLENYWNSGSPQAQARTLDNFVVSTQRIGC